LKREGVRTFTYFVGEGPDRSYFEQLADSLGVAEDICFLGECRPVAPFYRDSIDMLVLPTRYEALGLVLLEAGCFGVPAIASAVGGIPEVIQDGITGGTFEAGNERALALLIEQFSADMPKLRAMGRAARKRIESQFSAERMTREFEGLYEKLLGIPNRRLGWTHNSERLLTCLKLSIPRSARNAAAFRARTR
jgi:glycosyltransferase involved in cell wall biosynthesis